MQMTCMWSMPPYEQWAACRLICFLAHSLSVLISLSLKLADRMFADLIHKNSIERQMGSRCICLQGLRQNHLGVYVSSTVAAAAAGQVCPGKYALSIQCSNSSLLQNEYLCRAFVPSFVRKIASFVTRSSISVIRSNMELFCVTKNVIGSPKQDAIRLNWDSFMLI